ncbi:MAG: hypothetical protein ACI4JT_11035 [Oscillospiraceae bacterium]
MINERRGRFGIAAAAKNSRETALLIAKNRVGILAACGAVIVELPRKFC